MRINRPTSFIANGNFFLIRYIIKRYFYLKKGFHMNKIKSIVFILMVSFSALIQANRLFLENNYGAEIICKVNRAINNPAMPNREEPTTIANGVRVLLGLIPFNPEVRNAWVNNLEIKTSRYLPLSGFTSLQNYIEQLSDAF